jgi:thiol-disulfide isomerase/thioredoxin
MLCGIWSQTVNRRLKAGAFLMVATLAGLAGFNFKRASLISPTAEGAAHRLMSISLPDLNGKLQAVSQWRGKVLVVNFWATWCVPCREEIPALKTVKTQYASNGVIIVGIALDDVVKVQEYAAEFRVDYPLLMGSMETLSMTSDLGNRAGVLPYTVVLDRSGKVVEAHAGALTEASLGAILAPLL